MANKLKKTQPKAQEQVSKPSMLKRFGGKFKRAFSMQKQVCTYAQTLNLRVCRSDGTLQSLAQQSNEAEVQAPQLPSIPLLDSIVEDTKQLLTENKPGSASCNLGVEEAIADEITQEPTVVTSPSNAVPSTGTVLQDPPMETSSRDPAELIPSTPPHATQWSGRVSATPSFPDQSKAGKLSLTDLAKLIANIRNLVGQRGIVRSRSSPRLPSSPTTGASSETFIDSAYHSEASSPHSLFNFAHVLDAQKGLSKECHKARLEYIQSEEAESESSEWVALMKWVEVSHQAELINIENKGAAEVELLRQDRSKVRRKLEMQSRDFRAMKREMGELQTQHAEEVERLKQDRSQVRRRLEMQSREFKALKREMKELEESKRESIESQKEIQLTMEPQLNDGSGAESVDEEEGGVILAEQAEILKEAPSESTQIKDDGQKGKRPAKAIAKEERASQRILRQQLLEESMPDQPESFSRANAARPAPVGEVQASATPQSTVGFNGNNGRLFAEFRNVVDQNRGLKTNLIYARDTIAQLTRETESAKEEMAKLRAENRFAQLEVGHCHAALVCYHATFEEENPARIAHLDGLLKRKDEAYADLESRAAECAHLLAEEKKQTAIDNIYNLHKMQGLEKELAHRLNSIEALTEGRDNLREQNDSIIQMFKGKIFPNDAIKAILHDYETTQKDNALLNKILKERQCYILDAEKSVADLKADAAVQQHAMDQERLTHRTTLQSLNGLTAINHTLTSRIQVLTEIHAETLEHRDAQIHSLQRELQHVRNFGADHVLMQRVRDQESHIMALNRQLGGMERQVRQARLRVREAGEEGFCPMLDWDGMGLGGEECEMQGLRLRCWRGERRVRELEGWVRGVLGAGDMPGNGNGNGNAIGLVSEGLFTWRDV